MASSVLPVHMPVTVQHSSGVLPVISAAFVRSRVGAGQTTFGSSTRLVLPMHFPVTKQGSVVTSSNPKMYVHS